MKIKPILFSTPMVQAILENRKTQTRRIVKTTEGECFLCGCTDVDCRKCIAETGEPCYWMNDERTLCSACRGLDNMENAKYQRGDILWVRETWRQDLYNKYDYKADYSERIISQPSNKGIWKPSIHMPKAAARIFLEVTNVRVERLFDISEKDAIAEGIIVIEPEEAYNSYDKGVGSYATARGSFFSLWTSINGQASTDANPWVFVYEFKRVERPANF